MAADLVVDAAGRGTRLPVWLEQWGFGRPREDTVDVGISYATHQVHIPDGLIKEKVVVAGASREQPLGLGMLFYEDGNWGLTTFGTGKVEPPQNFAEMCALADEILPEHFAAAPSARASRSATWRSTSTRPAGGAATTRWTAFPPASSRSAMRWRASIPTFGQGMTMTSMQAGHLRRALESPATPTSPDEFNAATAKTTYPVWTMNAIGDLVLHTGLGSDAVVVPAGRRPLRPVPRRGRDRSRSRRMVSAPVQPARQPLHGPVDAVWSAGPSGTTCGCSWPRRRAR